MMNPITKKWGIWGAVITTVLFGTLTIIQILLPHNEWEPVRRALYYFIWEGVCYPVTLIWEVFFNLFGIKGDARMGYIFPQLATIPVYLFCLGFGIGVLLRRILKAKQAH